MEAIKCIATVLSLSFWAACTSSKPKRHKKREWDHFQQQMSFISRSYQGQRELAAAQRPGHALWSQETSNTFSTQKGSVMCSSIPEKWPLALYLSPPTIKIVLHDSWYSGLSFSITEVLLLKTRRCNSIPYIRKCNLLATFTFSLLPLKSFSCLPLYRSGLESAAWSLCLRTAVPFRTQCW